MARQSYPLRKTDDNLMPIPEKLKDRLYPRVLELFSRKDAYQVSISSISKSSGVSSGTIYKYFSSKEDLLFTIIEEKLAELSKRIAIEIQGLESARETFRKLLWIVMDFYDKNPHVAISAFISLPMVTWMQQDAFRNPTVKNIFIDIIYKGIDRGELDDRIDVRRFQDIFYMICYRFIHTWYFFGMKWRLADALSRDFDIFWKMLARPEDQTGN
ncbi:MAG: TetR/AcrR family transcriptional regulator [Deltaproteobacteria bacterium]|nr:TetR/AcrR family transcriptional regulator [Deltaproteobacteria bacterium]